MNPTAHLLRPEVEELIRESRYAELHDTLHLVPAADVAEIVADLDPKDAAIAFRFLPRDHAGEVFSYLPPEEQEELIKELGAETAVRVVEGMTPDDRARFLEELPTEAAQRLISSLSPAERRATQAILGYPPKSVGRLMTPDYIAIRPEWTVARSLEEIRRKGRDAEIINVVYVVDDRGTLIDDMRLRQLLLADPEQTLESLMNHTFIALRADQPQEEAVRTMAKYDRVALPVVDSRGVLLGIVTYDDVADVAEAEATEDIQKMGGLEALDEPYSTISLGRLISKRGKWLAALFIGEMLTASAMTHYEEELDKAVVLSLFLPLIISSGGNSGSQASTLIIRAMALQEIGLRDWARVFRRELACGLILGAFLGVIGLLRIHVWQWIGLADYTEHYHRIGVVVLAALIGVVLWGTLVGSMLPFLLRRLKLDPAAISAPFVATTVDVTGIVIYFTVAIMVLRGTLL